MVRIDDDFPQVCSRRWLGISQGNSMVGSIIVAFIGAVILVGITRLIKRA